MAPAPVHVEANAASVKRDGILHRLEECRNRSFDALAGSCLGTSQIANEHLAVSHSDNVQPHISCALPDLCRLGDRPHAVGAGVPDDLSIAISGVEGREVL